MDWKPGQKRLDILQSHQKLEDLNFDKIPIDHIQYMRTVNEKYRNTTVVVDETLDSVETWKQWTVSYTMSRSLLEYLKMR